MNIEPVRIQRSRKSEQVSPNGLPIVYVGRPTKWGNPFRVEEMYLHEGKMLYGVKTSNADCFQILVENCRPAYESKHDAIKDAVKCFAIYWGEGDASELRGKNLSCWCGETKPCHADILLKLANQKP